MVRQLKPLTPWLIANRFNHAPWDSLRRQNVLIWLAWTCFTLPLEEAIADPRLNEFLFTSMEKLEARTGTKFPDGFNPDLEVMRFTIDPVNVS